MKAKDYVISLRGLGLTQADISRETGISQPTISKIENDAIGDVMSNSYMALKAMYERHFVLPKKTKK